MVVTRHVSRLVASRVITVIQPVSISVRVSMHNVVHMQCEAPLQRQSSRGASASLAAVLTALIPAAAAVSAAVFVHSVGNGVAVHRMIPILHRWWHAADQCRAAWRKLLQTDGLQRIALLAAGVVRVRTCYMSMSKGFFAAPSSRLCAFVMWNGVLQRDGQCIRYPSRQSTSS